MVVVVAYHSSAVIEACLRSCLADRGVRKVVVVDNSSDRLTGEIVEGIASTDGRLGYIDPGANLGFGRACNLGAAGHRSDDWIAFVNPDVCLASKLSKLAAVGDSNQLSIVAGFLAQDRPPPYRINGRRSVTIGGELLKAIRGSSAYAIHVKSLSGEVRPVDQVDGALMVMSALTFDTLRGFDEQFELYYEDVDICRRAQTLGPIGIVLAEWGTHVGGASFAPSGGTAFVALRVSRARYLRKHYGWRTRVKTAIAAIAIVEFVARSMTRQSEGFPLRLAALRAQIRELRSPNSVIALQTTKAADGK